MPEILDYHFKGSTRDNNLQRFTQFVRSLGKRKVVNLAVVLLILLILPVTLLAVYQQQNLKQKAAADGNYTVSTSGIVAGSSIRRGTDTSGVSYLQLGTPISNKYGIHLLSLYSTPPEMNQRIWAKQLVGDRGYIKFYWGNIDPTTTTAPSELVSAVTWAYQNNLIPIVRIDGAYGNKNRCAPGLVFTCDQLAQKIKTVVASLPRSDTLPLWIEIANENNINSNWGGQASGAEYGQLLVLAAQAIRSIGDSRIKILNGGLAPDWGINNPNIPANTGVKATQFIRDMFTNNPALKNGLLDAWASHPYPDKNPPSINYHSGTATGEMAAYDSYIPELQVLASLGVNLPVMITETGYSANLFSRDAVAQYSAQAMQYWNSDSRVLGAVFFVMSNFPTGSQANLANTFSEYYFAQYTSTTNADGTPASPYPVYTTIRNQRIGNGL